jgi:phosphotransferase system IIB component
MGKDVNSDAASLDECLGCFGNFNRKNQIGTRHCALMLRCAIENEQKVRMEVMEDLVGADGIFVRVN